MKRAWALIIAMIVVFNFAGMMVFAENPLEFAKDSGYTDRPFVVNSDNDNKSSRFTVDESTSPTLITTPNYCSFDTTYYFALADDPDFRTYLSDTKYFKATISNKKNNNLLDGTPTLTTRSIDGIRYDVIRVRIKESGSKDEEEIGFTVKLSATSKDSPTGAWDDDTEFQVRFKLFASNDIDDSGDADIDAGDTVVFKPNKNDDNSITWGSETYPVASLEFDASSDADRFYARLSTKANSTIYSNYGDDADAELFFRTFSGDNIDATSRGTLTLYSPWVDDNYNYSPDPRNIWIYRAVGNELEDITNKFEYVSEDDTPEGIEGWQTRTRVLDAYVISDKELFWDNGDDWDDLPPADDLPDNPSNGGNDNNGGGGGKGDTIIGTGSHDFVPFALIAGIAALTVGFAVSRKKK